MKELFEEIDRIVKANDYLNSDKPSNYRQEEMWLNEDKPDEPVIESDVSYYPRLTPGASINRFWELIDKWSDKSD
jgi:hypothetical protein